MFAKEKTPPREQRRPSIFATILLGLRKGEWLYIIAPTSIFLICFYAFSSGDSSGKVKASNSKQNAFGSEPHATAKPFQASNAQTATSRKNLAVLVQQLQQACAAKDSTLLMQVEIEFESMRAETPKLYDYDFWLKYISQKRFEFARVVSHDSGRVATAKPSQSNAATSQNRANLYEQKQPVHAVSIAQPKAASTVAEKNRQTANNKISGPRRPANETRKISVLSENQKAEAEQLYVQGYKIMAYKNRTAYLQALLLFKKAQEIAPDPKFKYYQKAGEKIAAIEKNLAKFDNQ